MRGDGNEFAYHLYIERVVKYTMIGNLIVSIILPALSYHLFSDRYQVLSAYDGCSTARGGDGL